MNKGRLIIWVALAAAVAVGLVFPPHRRQTAQTTEITAPSEMPVAADSPAALAAPAARSLPYYHDPEPTPPPAGTSLSQRISGIGERVDAQDAMLDRLTALLGAKK